MKKTHLIKLITCGIFLITISTHLMNNTVLSGENPVNNEDLKTDTSFKALKTAAEKKVNEYPNLIKEGYTPYEMGKAKIVDGWALSFVYSIDANPPDEYDLIDSVTYLLVGQEKKDKSWDVYLETEKEFTEKENEAPEILLSKEAKDGLISKYEGWKGCENTGLAISLKIPQSWKCNNRDIGTNWGFMIIEGGSFKVEIENEGRGFGCMGYPGCLDTKIYDSNLITILLETTNNINKYLFGVFKDNTDERSFGGVYIVYDGINERNMTDSEENTLFMILDSVKRL